MKSFQETQIAFTKYLRAPDVYPAPAEIESRRLNIYRDLIYSNIENFIATVFPVLRSLLSDQDWHALMRDFIHHHRCQTPYFLQISEEFLQYLLQRRGVVEGDPAFLLELAHYEWIELALDVSEETIPPASSLPNELLGTSPRVSPLAVCFTYQYPVHKISVNFQPSTPEPTQLVVYRNRTDKVCFMAANAMTLRLLYLLQNNTLASLGDHLQLIASELRHSHPDVVVNEGVALIRELFTRDIISHIE